MRNLAPLVIAALCIGCATTALDVEPGIYVGKVEWVKMHPNEHSVVATREDGVQEIIVSNSCGTAETSYLINTGSNISVSMKMGEWCGNPFDLHTDLQLIVVGPSATLQEYHGLYEDSSGRFYALVGSSSILKKFETKLDEAVYLYDLDPADDNERLEKYIAKGEAKGEIEIRDNEVYSLVGVYLDEVVPNVAH